MVRTAATGATYAKSATNLRSALSEAAPVVRGIVCPAERPARPGAPITTNHNLTRPVRWSR